MATVIQSAVRAVRGMTAGQPDPAAASIVGVAVGIELALRDPAAAAALRTALRTAVNGNAAAHGQRGAAAFEELADSLSEFVRGSEDWE